MLASDLLSWNARSYVHACAEIGRMLGSVNVRTRTRQMVAVLFVMEVEVGINSVELLNAACHTKVFLNTERCFFIEVALPFVTSGQPYYLPTNFLLTGNTLAS